MKLLQELVLEAAALKAKSKLLAAPKLSSELAVLLFDGARSELAAAAPAPVRSGACSAAAVVALVTSKVGATYLTGRTAFLAGALTEVLAA